MEARALQVAPVKSLRTNGKVERFIQSTLCESLPAKPSHNSTERTDDMTPWFHRYSHHRPHAGIKAANQPTDLNNLLGDNT